MAATSEVNTGEIVYAPITLDGRNLFQIAANIGNSNNPNLSNLISPLEMRVEMYEAALSQILATDFNSRSLSVTPRNRQDKTIIFVSDGQQLTQQALMTVTELDAQIHGLSVQEIAQHFSGILRPALIQAQRERQREYLQHQGLVTAGILFGLIIITLLSIFWHQRLINNWDKIYEAQPQPIKQSNLNSEEEEIEYVKNKLMSQRRLNINQLKRWLLLLSLFILWVIGLAWIVGLFPYTRWFQDWLLTKPILVGIIIGTNLAIRGTIFILDYGFKRWFAQQSQKPTASPRQIARITTLSQVCRSLIAFLGIFIGTIFFLHKLHIPIAPVLAGAGIIGFAVSFSSQSLIRDIINGILILWEDQFAIGDIVDVGETRGFVENMNLRMTQIRGSEGRLSTVSNSRITTAHNLTKDWSRIDLTIEISPDTDIDQALSVIREVAEGMQQDPEWQDSVIDPVNVLGVNNISSSGIEILIFLKTQPGKQLGLGREFRRRLKLAFDGANITIGAPRQSLWLENASALQLVTSNGEQK
ncbi:MAG: mechanosensitive ion channel family protein [Spirulinaceae cyanobacterium]